MAWWLMSAAWAATLQVVVTGVAHDDGTVRVWVADRSDAWLEPERAVTSAELRPSGSLRTSFELPAGDYAVWVVHDRNDNGALDMRWLPYPRPGEPVAVSGGAQPVLGPPTFRGATVALSDDGLVLSLELE